MMLLLLLLLLLLVVVVVGMVVQRLICQCWNKTVAQHEKYVGFFTASASVSHRFVVLDTCARCQSHSRRPIAAPVMLLLVQSRAVVHFHCLETQISKSSHALCKIAAVQGIVLVLLVRKMLLTDNSKQRRSRVPHLCKLLRE